MAPESSAVGLRLHPYQLHEADFICTHRQAALFAEMGTGKTAATLEAIRRLNPSKVLVVSYPRIARFVWPEEAVLWKISHSCKCVCGSPTERKILWEEAKSATSPILRSVSHLLASEALNIRWDMVVFDESTLFKTWTSRRTKVARRLARLGDVDRPRVVLLTGTPAPNTLADLWSQIYLLDGGKALGARKYYFLETFFQPAGFLAPGIPRWVEKPNSERRIMECIRHMAIAIRTKDVLDLPPMLENTVKVPLPPKARKIYDDFQQVQILSVVTELKKGEDKIIASAQAAVGAMQQMASGFQYVTDALGQRQVHHVHDAKIEALRELVELTNDNVLIAYYYQEERNMLMEAFPEVKDLKEAENIEAWNRGEIRMACLHPMSGGHGLNLQKGGHTIIWMGPIFNLEHRMQFNARLHRQGQKEKVIIHTLIADGTIDEVVMKVVGKKESKLDLVMEIVKEWTQMN